MSAGTYCLTEYQVRLIKVAEDIVKHGFGEFSVAVTQTRDMRIKVVIMAGRSWVYFASGEVLKFGKEEIL